MARSAKHNSILGLVDVKQGLISRELFVNEELYQQEQEQLFAHCWLFVGHESQIPKPGDYFVSGMGEESVILTRDREQRIHVFLNTCRHRGMKVCRYDEGNTPVFTCPYHGWSYATDGRLVGVPYYKECYEEQLDKAEWGLVEVPQLVNYKGTIWATWDETAPPFAEYLGGMKVHLDTLLDCRDGREGGSEVLGGVQKWVMPCNWKFAAENFAGDAYHNISHRSVDLAGIGPSGAGRRDTVERSTAQRLGASFPDLGHGAGRFSSWTMSRTRRAIRTRRSSRSTSGIVTRSASGASERTLASSASSATCSPTRRTWPASRAPSPPGTRAGP